VTSPRNGHGLLTNHHAIHTLDGLRGEAIDYTDMLVDSAGFRWVSLASTCLNCLNISKALTSDKLMAATCQPNLISTPDGPLLQLLIGTWRAASSNS